MAHEAPAAAASNSEGSNTAQARFTTALTTEHFVAQTAASATVIEASARASLYLMTLSSSLVAIGFTSGTRAFGQHSDPARRPAQNLRHRPARRHWR
jgi:hypothetical protein